MHQVTLFNQVIPDLEHSYQIQITLTTYEQTCSHYQVKKTCRQQIRLCVTNTALCFHISSYTNMQSLSSKKTCRQQILLCVTNTALCFHTNMQSLSRKNIQLNKHCFVFSYKHIVIFKEKLTIKQTLLCVFMQTYCHYQGKTCR